MGKIIFIWKVVIELLILGMVYGLFKIKNMQ